MKRRLGLLVMSVALVATACGGDGADEGTVSGPVATPGGTESDSDSGSAGTAPQSTTITADDVGADPGETLFENPVGTAIVEVGDMRYEFDLDELCLTMFGNVSVNGHATDGSENSITVAFPPQDWETDDGTARPKIWVEDRVNNFTWVAGEEADVVTSIEYTSDGSRVFGEATFIDWWGADHTPVDGRFEVACPQD